MFNNTYKNKKVLITGNTGFKGSWLTAWLLNLGAQVIGFSKDIPTLPSMFETLGLEGKITHIFGDVRDSDRIKSLIQSERPNFIFHLAAQAIVSESYKNPLETFSTNVMGTINVLEALRNVDYPCSAILITSDKCYENQEWVWGYREADIIGGRDIYSGSKGAAELAIRAYVNSFFGGRDSKIRIGVCRAGNVIGGGDWAKDRIAVDAVKAWSKNDLVEVRSPNSTRPWQHVLEPLSGYLTLGSALNLDSELHGEAFNFGPRSEQNKKVSELLESMYKFWNNERDGCGYIVIGENNFKEAGLLKLNCDKALSMLNWSSTLEYEKTIAFVAEWYLQNHIKNMDMYNFTIQQINDYQELAKGVRAPWSY
jgi:CDP-glucose 4,6-dehydratase